jgi:hypothetical protein
VDAGGSGVPGAIHRVAGLVRDFVNFKRPPAKFQHLRHEGQAVQSAILVECRKYFFLATDLHPIAGMYLHLPDPRIRDVHFRVNPRLPQHEQQLPDIANEIAKPRSASWENACKLHLPIGARLRTDAVRRRVWLAGLPQVAGHRCWWTARRFLP